MSLRSPRRGRGYRRVCWHDPVVLLGYPHATVLWRELLGGVWDGYEHGYISWMLRVLWKTHHVAINAVHCASGIVVSNRWLWKLEWVLPCLFANVIANKPGWGVRFISLPLPPPWLVGWRGGWLWEVELMLIQYQLVFHNTRNTLSFIFKSIKATSMLERLDNSGFV